MFIAVIQGMNGTWFEQTIAHQRAELVHQLEPSMAALSRRCAAVWSDREALDRVLFTGLSVIPGCHLLYAMNPEGVQVSANVAHSGLELDRRGQDLSARPYTANIASAKVVSRRRFLLSNVYISQISTRPCVTAVHLVTQDDTAGSAVLGFVLADFDLHDLPAGEVGQHENPVWRQIKGDTSIRETLFLQQRVPSPMDERIDDVVSIMDELICERGVFHGKLYFSSSRATLWLADDPFRYRLHVLEEIINPSVCMAYPPRPYSDMATVPHQQVRQVFTSFKTLRQMDDTIYLRVGSLNVINGMVGLTFSCDGSHYMPVHEFLKKDESFWFGK